MKKKLVVFITVSALSILFWGFYNNDTQTQDRGEIPLNVSVSDTKPENPRGFTVKTSKNVESLWVENTEEGYRQNLSSENGMEWKIPRGSGPHPRGINYSIFYSRDGSIPVPAAKKVVVREK